ncbi:MAG: DUF5979 domain-containing protein [Treponema sp.]
MKEAVSPPPTGKEYKVTYSHTPSEGGNLTAKVRNGGAFISGAKAAENTVLEFTAEPTSKYSVGSWNGEGLTVSADKKSATLKVSKAVNVTVTFVANGTPTPPPTGKEYKVTYSHTPSEGGNLTAKRKDSGDSVASGSNVPENTIIEFTAAPKDGYRVKEWTGATVSAADKTKAALTVTGNADVKVTFEDIPKYKITFSAEPNEGGKITAKIKDGDTPVQSGDTLPAGTVVLFTANPSTAGKGYYILKWSGEDLKVSPDKTTAKLTVKKDTEVKVKFQEHLIENPNWEAVGILRTKDGKMKKFHMVINDGSKYFSFFDNSPGGGTYLADMTYDKSTKTVTLKEPLGEGTIRCVLMKDFTPSEWEIEFRGVRAESLELPDQTVKVEVTLNDNSIS